MDTVASCRPRYSGSWSEMITCLHKFKTILGNTVRHCLKKQNQTKTTTLPPPKPPNPNQTTKQKTKTKPKANQTNQTTFQLSLVLWELWHGCGETGQVRSTGRATTAVSRAASVPSLPLHELRDPIAATGTGLHSGWEHSASMHKASVSISSTSKPKTSPPNHKAFPNGKQQNIQ